MKDNEQISRLKERLHISKNIVKAEEDLQHWITLDLAELTCPVKAGDILKDTADPKVKAEVILVEPNPHNKVNWRIKVYLIVNNRKYKTQRYYYSMQGWELHKRYIK